MYVLDPQNDLKKDVMNANFIFVPIWLIVCWVWDKHRNVYGGELVH